jgi:extradiol dioxygenase family protein
MAVGQGTGVSRVRLVGINHLALEVGDVGEALIWYGQFFEFTLRGRAGRMAFIDLGDQFIALAEAPATHRDVERHFGLVVDDKAAVRRALAAAGVAVSAAPDLTFHDPWGNAVQVVDYREIQFTKAPEVLRAMKVSGEKTERALAELREKGITPPGS